MLLCVAPLVGCLFAITLSSLFSSLSATPALQRNLLDVNSSSSLPQSTNVSTAVDVVKLRRFKRNGRARGGGYGGGGFRGSGGSQFGRPQMSYGGGRYGYGGVVRPIIHRPIPMARGAMWYPGMSLVMVGGYYHYGYPFYGFPVHGFGHYYYFGGMVLTGYMWSGIVGGILILFLLIVCVYCDSYYLLPVFIGDYDYGGYYDGTYIYPAATVPYPVVSPRYYYHV